MDWKLRVIKRAMDVAGAGVGLTVAAPLFPIVAAAVKLTSPGPIFYGQVRCGAERRTGFEENRVHKDERRSREGYHTFTMYKFRTMKQDAEAATGPTIASKNDPRVTPIGQFLRKSRLDELPQLIHVLRGEMSLVGPRPERPELMNQLKEQIPFFEERARLTKPGLTGLAQVTLNYDGSLAEGNDSQVEALRMMQPKDPDPESKTASFGNKLLYDLAYSAMLENTKEAIKQDIKIIVKTPIVMLLRRGQ
ncbi:MAG: sugar transferase [Myxococcota bacterium]|nr:sugar transferase [Myxococcota bacterium]